jgi:hypothetical protein
VKRLYAFSWPSRKPLTWLAAVLLATVGALALTGPAGAAGTGAVECQMLVGKADAATRISPVLSQTCARQGETLAAPAASTLLMTWYKGVNYGGTPTKVYGAGGPCDNAGYGIPWVGHDWNDAIKSYKVHSNCWYSAAWVNINYGDYCAEYYGSVPNTVAALYDISSFWLTSGSWAWTLCSG